MRRVLAVFLACGALPAGSAVAEGPADPGPELVSSARRAHRAAKLPESYRLPGGSLDVSPAEQLAARDGATVRFTVRLDRPAAGAALLMTRPEIFTRRAASGLRFAEAPRLGRDAGGEADLRTDDSTVVVDLGSANAGDEASVSIEVGALSAGTYALPLSWRGADGTTRSAGTVRIRLYARTREEAETLREEEGGGRPRAGVFGPLRAESPAQAADSSSDGGEESETFLTVSPQNNRRILSAGNRVGRDTAGDAFISNDGGRSFAPLNLPRDSRGLLPLAAASGVEASRACCDPMMAADDQGNLWFGGLTLCDPQTQAPSRIYVNRIAAGTSSFSPSTAGLPIKTAPATCAAPTPENRDPTNTIQDKPMMTIDNAPGSPTFGRLYVTWDDSDPGGGVNVVLSACDTRLEGTSQPGRCDTGANWSDPVVVSGRPGGYTTSDPAVAPDGTVYVVWWDYGGENAIRMTRCRTACTTQAAWDAVAPANVAVLDSTGDVPGTNRPVPFSCPINAQPGGRAAPVPSVDVDRSGGANNGRIYVGWADLRPGSGTTKCEDTRQPLQTHLTFDAFVAGGTSFSELTVNPSAVSAQRGARLVQDTAAGPSAGNSDDFLSWVAVDQSNGDVWTDAYSTRNGDVTRQTTEFDLASVGAPFNGTRPTVSNLRTVSTVRSDYSDTIPCCLFDNDYGDYTGLDAAGDQPYPVWTDRQLGTDGDVFVLAMKDAPAPAPASSQTPPPATTTASSAPLPPIPPRLRARDTTPPVIRLGRLPTRLTSARTAALLVGPHSEPVRGTLALRTVRRYRRGSVSRTILLGRATFTGLTGLRSRPRVRVSRTNAALLRRLGRLRVRATVVLADAVGNRATRSVVFTLRPARVRR
jgi:hypothetical protein